MTGEQSKELIVKFLKESFNKDALLGWTSNKNVFQCTNANTPEDFFLIDWHTKWKNAPSAEERAKILNEFHAKEPRIFIGRGFITSGDTEEIAIKRLHSINKRKDINMFEVDKYENIYIAYY